MQYWVRTVLATDDYFMTSLALFQLLFLIQLTNLQVNCEMFLSLHLVILLSSLHLQVQYPEFLAWSSVGL